MIFNKLIFNKLKVNDFLTVKQKAQIYFDIVTAHSDHILCPYPKTESLENILKIGDKVKIIKKLEKHEKYIWPALVVSYNNKEFNILLPDTYRFFY